MNFLHCWKLNSSISRFAMSIVFGTATMGGVGMSQAVADEIIYNNDSLESMLKAPPLFVYSELYALYVGTAVNPSFSNNTVIIDYTDENKKNPGSVYGGLTTGGTSQNNRVYLKNGTVSSINSGFARIVQGYKGDTLVSDNSIEVSGGRVSSGLTGGYTGVSSLNDTANSTTGSITNVRNSIEVTDTSVGSSIIGAYNYYKGSGDVLVSQNTVEINNSNIRNATGAISGASGIAGTGNVEFSWNSVKITGNSIVHNIYGAQVSSYGGADNNTSVVNNSVEITDSTSGAVFGGRLAIVYGLNFQVRANSVKIDNSNLAGFVVGGYSATNSSTMPFDGAINVAVSDNVVEINNSNVSIDVYGGYEISNSTDANRVIHKDIIGNSVKINGSHIGGDVYGGYGKDSPRSNSTFAHVNVSDNSVEVIDSAVDGNIYGAYIFNDSTQTTGSYKANNNTVSLKGSNIKTTHEDENGVTQYGAIWGSRILKNDGSETTDFDKVVSGNTLNLVGYRGTVSGIYNFENFNWTLPSNVVNGDVLVTIADGGTAVNLTNTKHTIADMQVSDNRLKNGDEITFISKTQGTLISTNYTIKQGQFIVYDATLSQKGGEDNPLVLTISNDGSGTGDNGNTGGNTGENNGNSGNGGNNGSDNSGSHNDGQSGAKVNPQSKTYSEGRAAALGLVNQGNDLISTAGIDKVRVMVRAQEEKNNRPAFIPFLIGNGSYQSYKTGSHVDLKSFNMLAGYAAGFEFGQDHKATVGAFFEYGRGTYDTYNSFVGYEAVHGDGNSDYKGGGIFGRVDFAGTGLGRVSQLAPDQADGLYVEASFRAGRISNEFDVGRNAVIDGSYAGVYRGSYDSKVSYYGGHVAGGYVFNLDDKQSFDAYGRYLWTYMDGDTVTVMNEKLHFQSSTSSRIQIGGRYAYAYNEQFKPYIGAIYEYEFDGDVKAKAYEFNLSRPSLEGSSGIIEAGFDFHPVATNIALSMNMNGQFYVGQRQGGGGGVKIKYQY